MDNLIDSMTSMTHFPLSIDTYPLGMVSVHYQIRTVGSSKKYVYVDNLGTKIRARARAG